MATDSPPTAEQPAPKLRWFQYRLRSLFILTTLVAIGCSWLTVTIQSQRKGGSGDQEVGGTQMVEVVIDTRRENSGFVSWP
jgi:hypothetical protein